jgi:hypothetical protein
LKVRYVLGIDPSGSFEEGKGRTGWCIFDIQNNVVLRCGEIQARNFKAQEAYWLAHKHMIEDMQNTYKEDGLAVSMEDYILYTNAAASQIHSSMETCQLIGFIKMVCYLRGILLAMRTAVHVKKRWADEILIHNNYIYKVGKHHFVNCYNHPLSDHIRDAIRHAVHCATFELKQKETVE